MVEPLDDTDWHHYVLLYNGAVVWLFVDDLLVAEAPPTGTVARVVADDSYWR